MISITYNNVTGDYMVAGSDDGPGDGGAPRVDYVWEFDGPNFLFNSMASLTSALDNDGPFAGTAGGQTVTNFVSQNGVSSDPVSVLFRALVAGDPVAGGVLSFDGSSGTVAPSRWFSGLGVFVGDPTPTGADPTTSTLTFAIVPEPSSLEVLVCLLAFGLTLNRRRRSAT